MLSPLWGLIGKLDQLGLLRITAPSPYQQRTALEPLTNASRSAKPDACKGTSYNHVERDMLSHNLTARKTTVI